MAFRVGQLVQCIKKGEWNPEDSCLNSPRPSYGDICVVSAANEMDGYGYISLVDYSQEEAFLSSCFRPLQETGMSILKAILANPHKQLETVE